MRRIKTMKRFITLTILLSFLAIGGLRSDLVGTAAAFGPSLVTRGTATPSPTPDEELDQAKRQTALDQERQKQAEARQAEVEAKNATLKAKLQPLGASNVTVPSGNVSTDQAGF